MDVFVLKLQVHEQYERVFSEFRQKKFKLSKFKDVVKSSATASVQDAPFQVGLMIVNVSHGLSIGELETFSAPNFMDSLH